MIKTNAIDFANIITGKKDNNTNKIPFDFFYSNIAKVENGRAFFNLQDGTETLIGYKSGEPNLTAGDKVLIFQRGNNDFVILIKIQDVVEVLEAGDVENDL
jgi:hypothetical protein